MDPVLYHTHNTLRSDDLSFWRNLAADSGDPILELGCGTGRVLLRLLKDDHHVVGIDRDPDMLVYLQRLIPPTLAQSIEIYEADMRSFELNIDFPLIIMPCNTISIFSSADRRSIFNQVRKHLQPGGKFVFSMPNPLVLRDLPAEGATELEDEFTHPATQNPVQVYSSWEKDPDKITFYWRYDHIYSDGSVVNMEHSTAHVLDSPQEYVADLMACGLKPGTAYGDFYGEKFTAESSYFIVNSKPA